MNTKRRQHCQLWHDWKERIIRIGDEQTSLQNQFDNLRNEFTDNSPRIEALETNVNALDGRLIIAETDIAEAEDRITACEADIDRIDGELVDKTGDINALANRMSLAEADIDDIDARVSGIETGNILLSQLVPDADKDMGGKTLSNVNLNNATYGEYHINPRFLTGDGLIFDGQPGFMNRDLKTYSNPQYVEVEGAPHPIALTKTGAYGIGHDTNPEKLVRVSPGERVTLTATVRTLSTSDRSGEAFLCMCPYDSNKEYVSSKRILGGRSVVNDDIWREYTLTGIVPEDIYYISPYIYLNDGISGVTSQICDFKVYKEFNRNISAKLATFDGVVIADGGTVDGVDVSAHTHDGTTVGGPKISYNDLVDKPTVDISTHNHDGTAIGGPKISYNDLVNKPTIPTKLSQLATDDNNQRVSAAEKAEWNRISTHTHDGSTIGGPKISYNDLVDKPTIPTKLSQLATDYNNQRVSAAEKAKWDRISTHTHDGSTNGGPKISYNDLVDKPTIPTKLSQLDTDDNNQRVSAAEKAEWNAKAGPPVPFYRDMRNVYLASGGTYSFGVDMGPIVPPGRIGCTPFTLWMQISDINGSVDLRLDYIFDDNSIGRSDPLPSTNGQHHVELKHLLPTTNDYSRKKFIKDIRIKNVQTGSCTITASLKGFVY